MTTALYRRYRPDTFEEVIGQGHVTHALQAALSSDRIAHAFLFSGPRGCGKTSSARILARCLNCAEGPTATPCGKCESCIELASGGPGSLDVMEIDAASNRGVENAKELRERATFAPSRDRYRIFILDEAHMVTKEGFNALLKLVEEPPEHVKFIFATTEPEKVLSTIRSRTHHYPFRLVGPDVLVPYMKGLAEQEHVSLDEGVYSLLVRAGGGSVRDTLSVMDQLIAGSGGHATVAQAQGLLGYTDAALLERAVDALGQDDGAAAFEIVEEVIGSGLEPRRFVEDLLQRLRDLMVCSLARERAADILLEIPEDQLMTMHSQAAEWGTRLLSRRADVVEAALREMSGATAPRLQLELLMARLLVSEPGEETAESTPPQARKPVGRNSGSAPQAAEVSPVTKLSGDPDRTPAEHSETKEVQSEAKARPVPAREVPEPRSSAEVPSTQAVRENWSKLKEIGRFGAALPGLLNTTRKVEPFKDHLYFFMTDDATVQRFRRMNGEQHLSTVLSEVFERSVSARVLPLNEADRLFAGEPVWESQVEQGAESSPSLSPARTTTAPEEEHPQGSVASPTGKVAGPDEEAKAVPGSGVEPGGAVGPPETKQEAPAPTEEQPKPAPATRTTTEAVSAPAVEVVQTAGRPAADVVLDILGGVVIGERLLEETPPALYDGGPEDYLPPEVYDEVELGGSE